MLNKFNCATYALKILFLCLLFFCVIFFLCDISEPHVNLFAETSAHIQSPCIIIDAGHGGRDGGASTSGGILEKNLNLSVAFSLNDIMKLCGIETVMTRENDRLACDEDDPNLKGKIKITDLKNRLKIANEYPEAIFVSIHMNNFSVEKYKGLQVYYSANNEKSFSLAKNIQENVCKVLQPENNRKVKKAGSNIFLLDRIQSPAILIECGFLSNKSESEKLAENSYQTALSLIFADSLLLNLT